MKKRVKQGSNKRVENDAAQKAHRASHSCRGNYESVAGATPAFIKGELTADICRTNIMFGSGNAKHPLILASKKSKRNI
jgi:hypothetical protein